ncbi:energy transducer TonB [Tenacibaculum sp. nBUS_03]|uniref:energy transducer TonB n=1 Tax=Tenacibaculum sp. nBUS_03 TaxID=3395320 RepID=UPI003EBEE227
MIKPFILFCIILSSFTVFSQEVIEIEDTVEISEFQKVPLHIVQQPPRFKGDKISSTSEMVKNFNKGITKHIKTNIQYPNEAKKDSINGYVYVEFLINKKGEIKNIKSRAEAYIKNLEQNKNKISKLFDNEAVRIIKCLPKLHPAEHKGKKIEVRYTHKIKFNL